MLKTFPEISLHHKAFQKDTYSWLTGARHGHMGKWQYLEPHHADDPCHGNELWDIWEKIASSEEVEPNMLRRQHEIIQNHACDMAALSGARDTLIDLGPGGRHGILKNTVPFIDAKGTTLKKYIALDLNEGFANNAAAFIRDIYPSLTTDIFIEDFTAPKNSLPQNQNDLFALLNGGTIGNFEAEANTPHAVSLMAQRIQNLRQVLPQGTLIFISLETTQDCDCLYHDYSHPAHAAFSTNFMHGIKRDLLPDEDGFQAGAWKYAMKWWPDAYQFCHIVEATESQKFTFMGEQIIIQKGTQLIADNSFKFPVLAMHRAVQMAGGQYIRAFMDSESRMALHALYL